MKLDVKIVKIKKNLYEIRMTLLTFNYRKKKTAKNKRFYCALNATVSTQIDIIKKIMSLNSQKILKSKKILNMK